MSRRDGLVLAASAGVLVTPWAWLAGASFIYCTLLGRQDLWEFPFDQWWLAAPWWRQNWLMLVFIPGSAAVPTFVLAMAVYVVWRLVPRRRVLVPAPDGGLRPIEPGVTNNHGHAAWATKDHVLKRFSPPGCLLGAVNRSPGAPLLFDNVNTGPGHSMVFAGPGSHKSMTAITRLFHWHGPRVVFDPSCEIGPIMTEALQAEGCRVVAIGLNGQGVNALDWIDPAHPEADAHIRSVVDWVYNEGAATRSGGDQGRDPFWSTWGRSLVTCLLADLVYSTSEAEADRTLANLRLGIATPESDMPTLLRGIHQKSASRMARDISGGLMNMKARETFSGIYANAFAGTEWMSVGAYADVISGDAIRTSDILDGNTVVFIQLPLRTLLATPAVGRAVLGAFFNAMFHADGQGNERILFLLDEAWILGRLKEILLCHATARKYRGAVQTIWQSEKQLQDVWGPEGAGVMRDTVSWRSYNAIQDGDVAEKLSRDIGTHAVMAYSEGSNQGSQKPFGFALPSSNRGSTLSTHEIKRRLISGDEILRAPADEMFVLARDFANPIRAVTAPYFRYPELARRMKSNRFASME